MRADALVIARAMTHSRKLPAASVYLHIVCATNWAYPQQPPSIVDIFLSTTQEPSLARATNSAQSGDSEQKSGIGLRLANARELIQVACANSKTE